MNKKPAQIFHFDLYGKRVDKYDFLNENSLKSIAWTELNPQMPELYFVPKNFEVKSVYDEGFGVNELFIVNGVGLTTAHDEFVIKEKKEDLLQLYQEFQNTERDVEILHSKFKVNKKDGWNILQGYDNIKNEKDLSKYIKPISYRPFDDRFVFYEDKLVWRTVRKVMQHFLKGENLGLVIARQCVNEWQYVFCTKLINEFNLTGTAGRFGSGNTFPLYLYPDTSTNDAFQCTERRPNLNEEIVQQIAEKLGLKFVPEKNSPPMEGCPEGGVVLPPMEGCPEGGVVLPPLEGYPTKEDFVATKRNTKNYMNLPFNPDLKQRAKELRQAGNLSEVLFWNQVKKKQFKGFDFDRQKVIGNYIVDFYCSNCNVVIEIDGSSHDDKLEYDKKRDEFLEGLGLTVIHIAVKEVFNNMDGVVEMLINHPALSGTKESDHPALSGIKESDHPDLADAKESDHPALSGTPPEEGNVFAPIDILDYIYAVLHSPNYREKYKEFLKIDFPRVPYPKDVDTFWKLVKLGGEIRQIHLLESLVVEKYITKYPIDGDNKVLKPKYDNGKVFINDTQYFDQVPEVAWNFYIGGYQPAQKWLKDRKDRTLEFNDIQHYQKIIVALTETDRLMKEVDKVGVEE